MYSAYKLNKQGDSIQPCHTPFPVLDQVVIPCPSANCCFLTYIQICQETSKVDWYSYLFKNFPQFVVIHTVKGFSVVNKIDFFFWISLCFLFVPTNVGSLISGSSALSKPSLYIWKFLVHILLKLSFKDFEHYLPSMWNKHNCMIVWTFLCIAFLWDWNENWQFPVLWSLLSFPNLRIYWVQHFTRVIF